MWRFCDIAGRNRPVLSLHHKRPFLSHAMSQRGDCSSTCTPCKKTCLTTSRILSVRPGTSAMILFASRWHLITASRATPSHASARS